MQRSGRADFHALRAANAGGEEFIFLHHPRWADAPRVILPQAQVGAEQQHSRCPACQCSQGLPPRQVEFFSLGRLEPEAEADVSRLAVGHAIQAHGAFRGHDVEILRVGVNCPRLALHRAARALSAGSPDHRAEQGDFREQSQQCPQRAQVAAPEAVRQQVQGDQAKEKRRNGQVLG